MMKLKNSSLPLLSFAIACSVLLNAFLLYFDATPTKISEPCVDERLQEFRKPSAPVGLSAEGQKNDEDSISACLLIKDDNEILNEWLAYHYHVLDMRYLVVAVDPSSETSPAAILDRWRSLTKLEIVEWDDEDFMPDDFLKKGYYKDPKSVNTDATQSKWHEGHEDAQKVLEDTMKIENHRFRQVTFLSSCFHHMRDMDKRWVVHIDTDEYVVVNPFFRRRKGLPVTVPSVGEAGSVASVLRQVHNNATMKQRANFPCVSMPRLLYGSVEKPEESVSSKVPDGLNATLFETVRWVHHTGYEDKERNAQPKVIVDVSALPARDEALKPKPFSIHRPSKRLCRTVDQLYFPSAERFPLSVNHYVGTAERYFARNDTRRSERFYNFKAQVDEGRDTWIASWLGGFVKAQGRKRAFQLLREYTVPGAADGVDDDDDGESSVSR